MTNALVLGKYDAAAIDRMFVDAGVLRALEQRGFSALAVTVESDAGAPPHVRLFGSKADRRHRLLDTILIETVIRPEFFAARGHAMIRPIELVLVHWLREEDPTASFSTERPRLPLQDHPGLGVLRRAFKVAIRIATERGKDGVASLPKLFHDAAIFYHSRLFLFLDAGEQGRFAALARDLAPLALGDASLAMVAGCVHDAQGSVERWRPSLQVFPISMPLADYFHSPAYEAQATGAFADGAFRCDRTALERARAVMVAQ